MSRIGDIVNDCFELLLCLVVFSDILKEQLGQRCIFLVEKQSTKELFVMKMINIGREGSEVRRKAQKEITAEINIWLTLGQECPFLVRYLETFYHDHFFCLIMEYCELGDLQKELDSEKQYEEPVSYLAYSF
jgi:serine/threonine protein kinase